MRIKKNLSVFTALICSIVLSFPVFAEEYRCEVTSYSSALKALSDKAINRITIVKSWIPANFTLNNCGLTFDGWSELVIKKPPKNGVYRAHTEFHDDGKPLPTQYRVHIQKEGKGYISMQMRGYVKMGPVPIMCELVEDSPSTDTCAEQEN